ncbi:MAG: hypothetical protein NTU94_18625, partial [Planctomycetota bacterium]|nr:hypothetical protein [Planctomycetota bacterium]
SEPSPLPLSSVLQWAQAIDLELIEAPRALPVLDEDDYRVIRCYVQHFHQKKNSIRGKSSFLSRILGASAYPSDTRQVVAVTDSSKLLRRNLSVIAPISEVDLLITDTGADPDCVESIRARGVEVLLT